MVPNEIEELRKYAAMPLLELGEAKFMSRREEGRALTIEHTIELAIEVDLAP